MLKKSLIITALALALGLFLYFRPLLFNKIMSPRIIDRLPDAEIIGKLNLLDLAKETSNLLYFYKTPFRDLTSSDYMLGQGKTYGLNLQKPIYIFGNENGEWGAIIQVNDGEKAKQGLEKLKQNIAIIDSSRRKTPLYFMPKLNLFLHYSENYILLYSGKKINQLITRVKSAKYKSISKLWKSYINKQTFKNENLVVYSNSKKLKTLGIDYALFAHDSDSSDFNLKCYFHKLQGFPFSNKKIGLGFLKQNEEKRSIDLHLDADNFRYSTNNPIKNYLVEKGKKISFPTLSFFAAWDGILSFVEGGKQKISERIVVSELDEDFNVRQIEKFRNVEVPGYSLLFNMNEKGPGFIKTLLQKGILRQEGNQYRLFFSPLLNLKIKDNYYYFYSGKNLPKTEENDKNSLLWPINQTNYFFKINEINNKEIIGTVRIPANKIIKQLLNPK